MFTKALDCLACFTFSGLSILGLFHCLMILLFLRGPGLFNSLLPNGSPYLLCVVVNIPCAFAVVVYYMDISIVLIFMLYFGLFFIPLITREFRLGKGNKFYKTTSELRQSNNLMAMYRSAQVLLIVVNNLGGLLLIPAQATVTKIFVFSSYFIIKHGHRIEIPMFLVLLAWAWLAFSIWSIILWFGGYLHMHGQKTLASWRRVEYSSDFERKLMKRFTASCKPASICYGKMFVIRKVSLFIYFRGLIRGLKKVLLAL